MKRMTLALLILCYASPALAQNSAALQMQLASDQIFVQRIAYLMAQYAIQTVVSEGNTPSACTGVTTPTGQTCHAMRDIYAHNVIQAPVSVAAGAVVSIVGGTNLTSVATTCTTTNGQTTCTSAATDAAIASQIATFWNALAGAQ